MNWLFLMTVILVLTMMTFAFVIRYFVHLERMALIRQGIIPPAMATPIFRRGSFGLLIAGLVTLFSGCGLLLGLYLGLGISFWLVGGFLPIGVGLALIVAYMFGGHQADDKGVPPETSDDGGTADGP